MSDRRNSEYEKRYGTGYEKGNLRKSSNDIKRTTYNEVYKTVADIPPENRKKVNEIERILGISIRNNPKSWIDADFETEQIELLSRMIENVFVDGNSMTTGESAYDILSRYHLTPDSVSKLEEITNNRVIGGSSLHSALSFLRIMGAFDGKQNKKINLPDSKAFKLMCEHDMYKIENFVVYFNLLGLKDLKLSDMSYEDISTLLKKVKIPSIIK